MLRLFFGQTLGPQHCCERVRQACADAQQRLATFAAIRAEMAAEPEYAAHQPYWLLTVSAGEHAARATRAWAEEALHQLDNLDQQKP